MDDLVCEQKGTRGRGGSRTVRVWVCLPSEGARANPSPQLTGEYPGEPLLLPVPRFEASLWAGVPLSPAGLTKLGQLRAGFKLFYSGAPDQGRGGVSKKEFRWAWEDL